MSNKILKKVLSKLEKEKAIIWVKPDLSEESNEYFENNPTKEFLKSHSISFDTEEEFLDFFEKGKLTKLTREQLEEHSENLELVDEASDWKDTSYQESYNKMQQSLIAKGQIRLPAPIFIKAKEIYYCFAGNRRVNLAFNNNIPLLVWLVQV